GGVRRDEGSAVEGVRGENAQGDAQLSGRADGHPGELAGADHADDGEPAWCRSRRRDRGTGGLRGRGLVGVRNEVGHAAENTLPERAQAYAGPVPAAFTSLLDRLRVAIGLVYREMIKFGVIGAIAFVID